jgi:DnaJ-class molecular chaperone
MPVETCRTCGGSGEVACAGCSGAGQKSINERGADGREYKSWSSCANCNGKGSIGCRRCGGSGETRT